MIYTYEFQSFNCTQFHLPSPLESEPVNIVVPSAGPVILVNMPPCYLISKYSYLLFISIDIDSFSSNNLSLIENMCSVRARLIKVSAKHTAST